jgi:hypothetical protein
VMKRWMDIARSYNVFNDQPAMSDRGIYFLGAALSSRRRACNDGITIKMSEAQPCHTTSIAS